MRCIWRCGGSLMHCTEFCHCYRHYQFGQTWPVTVTVTEFIAVCLKVLLSLEVKACCLCAKHRWHCSAFAGYNAIALSGHFNSLNTGFNNGILVFLFGCQGASLSGKPIVRNKKEEFGTTFIFLPAISWMITFTMSGRLQKSLLLVALNVLMW